MANERASNANSLKEAVKILKGKLKANPDGSYSIVR